LRQKWDRAMVVNCKEETCIQKPISVEYNRALIQQLTSKPLPCEGHQAHPHLSLSLLCKTPCCRFQSISVEDVRK
jgi:hypothetical protein